MSFGVFYQVKHLLYMHFVRIIILNTLKTRNMYNVYFLDSLIVSSGWEDASQSLLKITNECENVKLTEW